MFQRSLRRRLAGLILVGIIHWFVSVQTASACPNCPPGLRSYAEHLASSDAVVLTEWVQGTNAADDLPGSTTVRIRQVVKGPRKLVPDTTLKLNEFRSGKRGDQLLLFGTIEEDSPDIIWNEIVEVNPASFQYILKVPAMEVAPGKRLSYFLQHLEFPNDLIANDAFAEFANSEYKDLVALAPEFPREKLRRWMTSAETSPIRLGLYATMLGLCGTAEDAKLLETRMSTGEAVGAYRLGLEGMISGYLMIQGEGGLDLIETKFLKNKSAEFSETYAAAQGLRFMWTYSSKIPRDRLCRSMEVLLDRPELADLVIADLARWKDWSVHDRLMKFYGKKDYDTKSIKQAIVRFLIVCAKQQPVENNQAPGTVRSAEQARLSLAKLRQIDPETVAAVERFFLVP